jgi:hypothetical protein
MPFFGGDNGRTPSYMVPGGVMCAPTLKDITRAHAIMNQFRNDWLEPVWLGCFHRKIFGNQNPGRDMMEWLNEK